MRNISRRKVLTASAFGIMLQSIGIAQARTPKFRLESGSKDIHTWHGVHEGLGDVDVRLFDFEGADAPANFMVYDMPVGASEGVHLHNLEDPALGPYDEFYYIVEGRGKMVIDDETFIVSAGDHVHAPLDTWRGIANADDTDRLKVFLTYIDRSKLG